MEQQQQEIGSTCLRHPSQILTGICSSCLAERLASVGGEIVEIGAAAGRVRRTLLSLFELDDRSEHLDAGVSGIEKIDHSRSGRFRLSSWRVRRSLSQRRVVETREGKHTLEEAPRHSWDGGSVVSKAFACSFTCLDEPSSVTDGHNARESDNAVQRPALLNKPSRRWSRVWDWSVMSPFRDFGKKRGHVLERSLSESWREGKPKQGLNTNVNRNACVDRQKRKEYRFGRSRSVHYSSPGNLDNGLLRFYLTPLRSSRRSTGKGRVRSSHSLSRGILGLH